MIFGDLRSAIALMDMRLYEAQRPAPTHLRVHSLDGGLKARGLQRLHRMLHNLGHSLVTVGRYLERRGLSEQSL
jgi:hypothetical protein